MQTRGERYKESGSNSVANAYGEPDVGNLLVRFDEDLRGGQSTFLSGYSTVHFKRLSQAQLPAKRPDHQAPCEKHRMLPT